MGFLALVLVAGLGTFAFAQPITLESQGGGTPADVFAPSADESDSIFDGGTSNSVSPFANGGFPPGQSIADDFVLTEDAFVTDVHFDLFLESEFNPLPESYTVIFYDDDEGKPGNVIAERSAVEIESTELNFETVRIWFDLDQPVLLDGGVTYWMEIRQPEFQAGWWSTDTEFGNKAHFRCDESLCGVPAFENWTQISDAASNRVNFVLTGHPPEVVGGEFLPIDSATLMLAGFQSSAIWMLPALAGIAGTAFGVMYFKTRRN